MNRFKGILLVMAARVLLTAGTAHAGYTITTLATFNGSNGQYPLGGVILSGSTLYGTTEVGGAYNGGTVFSVPITGGTSTILASFSGSNGAWPVAGLTLSGNAVYGTTEVGGANNDGTVFSVPITGGTPTLLASFNGSNGWAPSAGLTLAGSALYGTTEWGGANGDGVVFSVPITGGTPTVLASLDSGETYATCGASGLTLAGNALYGTTKYGGADRNGAVFSVPITGGTPTILASCSTPNDELPCAGVILSGNALYGTTAVGGDNCGKVFSVPITGGTPTTLASFNGTNGNMPESASPCRATRSTGRPHRAEPTATAMSSWSRSPAERPPFWRPSIAPTDNFRPG